MNFEINVNGKARQVDVDPETPLLWVLRDELHLTATKFGCGVAQCGACTVHVEGQPARSCVLPMKFLGNRSVVTLEGASGKVAEVVQEAWEELQVPQCGYCQTGQIMTTIALLEEIPNPSDQEIDGALTGNVCRCSTYPRIRGAVRDASKNLES